MKIGIPHRASYLPHPLFPTVSTVLSPPVLKTASTRLLGLRSPALVKAYNLYAPVNLHLETGRHPSHSAFPWNLLSPLPLDSSLVTSPVTHSSKNEDWMLSRPPFLVYAVCEFWFFNISQYWTPFLLPLPLLTSSSLAGQLLGMHNAQWVSHEIHVTAPSPSLRLLAPVHTYSWPP